MSKRVQIEGKSYRKRRGKLVEIQPEWVEVTVYPQTKRKRHANNTPSRRTRSLKK